MINKIPIRSSLIFLNMICLLINYHLVMKKNYILALKFDHFALAQNRALHRKEINIV